MKTVEDNDDMKENEMEGKERGKRKREGKERELGRRRG